MAFVLGFGFILLFVICRTCAAVAGTLTAQVNAIGQVMRSSRQLMTIKDTVEKDAVKYEHLEAKFDATVNDHLKINFVGDANTEWWGTEHIPVLLHAAKVAEAKGERCVVVEAGAHRGADALVAAKLGCEVYAFEMNEDFCNGMVANMKLNNISTDQMHIFCMAIGDEAGHRIDEHVPDTKHVTVLKMDIDGSDVFAMRGASKLFSGAGIDFVNLEFSPQKHWEIAKVPDTQYIKEMDALGFDAYLLDCYKGEGDIEFSLAEVVGAHCLAFNRGSTTQLPNYEEPENQKAFLGCIMEGKCNQKSRASNVAQRIPEEKFDTFVHTLYGNEVDLILTKRQQTIRSPELNINS